MQAFSISADSLRMLSVVTIFLFGLTLIVPQAQIAIEKLFSKLASRANTSQEKHGLWGGIIIGLSLGLVWTPCVGPILAAVISLALTGSVNLQAAIITLAYSLGTAIPMFLVMWLGRNLFERIPWLLPNTGKIQRLFGALMIITSMMIYFNWDRSFQSWVLIKFPSYGSSLTSFEENSFIKDQIKDVIK